MNEGSSKPLCSVLIATFNRAEALAVTLQDLGRQSSPPDEILVVDQSTDDGGEAEKITRNHAGSTLRYFRQHAPNAQKARNLAIKEARGEVLLFVDDDMRLPQGFVAAHLENYRDPDIDGVAGQVLKPGQKPTLVLAGVCRKSKHGWLRFPLHYARRTACVNWPTCNGSVKRAVALSVGGFDEQFTRTLYDDTDFSHRMFRAGARIVFDPGATAIHRKIPSGGRRPAPLDPLVLADAENWATVFYCWRKNFGLWAVRVQLSRKLREVFLRKTFFLHPGAFLSAVRELARGWKSASRKLAQGPIYGWTPSSI